MFYDASLLKDINSLGSLGAGVLLENVLDYSCIQNKRASVEQVLQAKAFMDLHEREFNYTLRTLYTPRIVLEEEHANQLISYVECNEHSDWYQEAANDLLQRARYWSGDHERCFSVFMKVVAREIHENFKNKAIERLQQIEQNPEIMQRIEKYSRQYFAIKDGQIPPHIQLVREITTQGMPKSRLRGRKGNLFLPQHNRLSFIFPRTTRSILQGTQNSAVLLLFSIKLLRFLCQLAFLPAGFQKLFLLFPGLLLDNRIEEKQNLLFHSHFFAGGNCKDLIDFESGLLYLLLMESRGFYSQEQ